MGLKPDSSSLAFTGSFQRMAGVAKSKYPRKNRSSLSADEMATLNLRISERATFLGKSDRQVSMEATGKPDPIRDIRRHRDPGAQKLKKIANALETTVDYLLGRTDDASRPGDDQRAETRSGMRRALPVLDPANAAAFAEMDAPPYFGGASTLIPDTTVSTRAFAITLADKSMEPEFIAGDIVVIDPEEALEPGDFVLFQPDRKTKPCLRQYHRRQDADGHEYAELVPLNKAWETIDTRRSPGRLLGKMISLRRSYTT